MTMTLIESKTLTATTASVEFTSIPQDGTDLVAVISARSNDTANNGGSGFQIRPNGATTNITARTLEGTGSAATSDSETFIRGRMGASDWTANTFGNVSVYISNYTGSQNKSVSVDSVAENNATLAFHGIRAGLWSSSSAVTSLTFVPIAGSFVSGSIASLYKITKGTDGIVTTS
jgi:hypothetical protein